MNITMAQDSTSKRVRVRRGKNRRARNATMAATNAPSRPSTGHNWVASARDQTSTRAASAKHRISMDRVLRTSYLESGRRGHRSAAADGRHLQFLKRALHFRVTLQQRRLGRHGHARRLGIALQLDVGGDASVIDGDSGRRVIERGGQLDGAVAGQGNDGLYRTLAEGGASHEFRTVVILESPGDDLRRGRRSTIDQYHDRRAID